MPINPRTVLYLAATIGLQKAVALNDACQATSVVGGFECLSSQNPVYYSGYCSSVLSISTPTTRESITTISTITVVETSTTHTQTVTADPTTKSVTRTSRVDSTATVTDTSTITTQTYTSFSATTTTTSTSTSYSYTCPISNSSHEPSSFSDPPSSTLLGTGSSRVPPVVSSSSYGPYENYSASASIAGGPIGTGSLSIVPYGTGIVKRAPTGKFPAPRCLKVFKKAFGKDNVSQACECFHLPTPAPVTRTVTKANPSITSTTTNTIYVGCTTTTTPTVTARFTTIKKKHYTTTEHTTTSEAATIDTTFTQTVVVTSIVSTSRPVPTLFNIFYYNSTANNASPPANYFKAVPAPGGSGYVFESDSPADNFALDSMHRLVDETAGGQYIAKNTKDVYPWEFLQVSSEPDNTPTCNACNGILQCDYPGTTGNEFAVCNGFLALGSPEIFGKDNNGDGVIDCTVIALQYK